MTPYRGVRIPGCGSAPSVQFAASAAAGCCVAVVLLPPSLLPPPSGCRLSPVAAGHRRCRRRRRPGSGPRRTPGSGWRAPSSGCGANRHRPTRRTARCPRSAMPGTWMLHRVRRRGRPACPRSPRRTRGPEPGPGASSVLARHAAGGVEVAADEAVLQHRALHVVAALAGREEPVADQVAGAHPQGERLCSTATCSRRLGDQQRRVVRRRRRPHRTRWRRTGCRAGSRRAASRLLVSQLLVRMPRPAPGGGVLGFCRHRRCSAGRSLSLGALLCSSPARCSGRRSARCSGRRSAAALAVARRAALLVGGSPALGVGAAPPSLPSLLPTFCMTHWRQRARTSAVVAHVARAVVGVLGDPAVVGGVGALLGLRREPASGFGAWMLVTGGQRALRGTGWCSRPTPG